MGIDELLSKVKKKEDIFLIEKAYLFADARLSNIDYTDENSIMQHVLAVANTLLDFNADNLTIISALLYETINYGVSKEEIAQEFDSQVANIAFGTATINNLEHYNSNDYETHLKETLSASEENVRSLFIKLAERFYNMQNMQNLSKQQQRNIAEETLNVLTPAASRLGLNFIRSKLEDLCLYYLKPKIYNEILERLNGTPSVLNTHLNNMKESISNLLAENNISCTIKSRVKSIYSIYNKLCNGKSWEDIYDILALRILAEKDDDCTRIVDLIHSKYAFIPSRLKDYINSPKENMYQSIHTTIIGEDNRFYEIQVRTYEMNKTAENGSASHRLFKKKNELKSKKTIYNLLGK